MKNLQADKLEDKQYLRQLAYTARNLEPNKDKASTAICQQILSIPEYLSAAKMLWYVDCRSEVRTFSVCPEILNNTLKTIVIPYCTVDQQNHPSLGLWRLKNLRELQPGMWDILEPVKNLRDERGRKISPQQLDLAIIPGVGFDKSGGRIGNGKGYYDRLLCRLNKKAMKIGACYESQLFEKIPMNDNDIPMDLLVTEKTVYRCN